MRNRGTVVLGIWILLSASASNSQALSVSSADLAFASYGQATHSDQSNEYLGALGTVYDGLTFPSFFRGHMSLVGISPTVGKLFSTGDFEYLSVWIDWDQSRTFDTWEEVIDLDDEYFALGTHPVNLDISVPTTAALGSTWMRARFSFDGDLTPTGAYYTGEVEDYAISVADTVIPEPGTCLLLLVGLALGVPAIMHRRRAG